MKLANKIGKKCSFHMHKKKLEKNVKQTHGNKER